jgi:serine/threonine protein kinase
VHRDLKTLNLLVNNEWVIKVRVLPHVCVCASADVCAQLCDYGLARFVDEDNLETLAKLRGTMAYCPPEAYFGEVCACGVRTLMTHGVM